MQHRGSKELKHGNFSLNKLKGGKSATLDHARSPAHFHDWLKKDRRGESLNKIPEHGMRIVINSKRTLASVAVTVVVWRT